MKNLKNIEPHFESAAIKLDKFMFKAIGTADIKVVLLSLDRLDKIVNGK